MPKPPIQRAKEWHDLHYPHSRFEQLLGKYLAERFVWCSPTEFVMAAPVRHDEEKDEIIFDDPKPDSWFVYLASGDNPVARLMDVVPYDLPHVLWCRRKGKSSYRKYKTERLKRYGRH